MATPLVKGSTISNDFTKLGVHVSISGDNRDFQMKRGKEKDDNGQPKMQHPVVYFSFRFGCDEDPLDLISQVAIGWGRMGGERIKLNELGSFDTKTPAAIYKVLNSSHQQTLNYELRTILEEEKQDMMTNNLLEKSFRLRPIPKTSFRRSNALVPGMNTQVYQGWDNRRQQLRKVLHIECAKTDSQYVMTLLEHAKHKGLIAEKWGRNVHISAVLSYNESTAGDCKRMTKVNHEHINYHASMTGDTIDGIIHLDEAIPVYSVSDRTQVVGQRTMRQILYSMVKLSDGHSLFAEIHQRVGAQSIEVVVPNTPEAETMIAMMNKNTAAYLYYYLLDMQVDRSFLLALLGKSCCPTLVHAIQECTWDSKERSLLTAREAAEDETTRALESAAWYKNEFASDQTNNKNKQAYAAPESLYNLDAKRSVKTIHERNNHKYIQVEGSETLQLGKKKSTTTTDDDSAVVEVLGVDDSDTCSEVSALSNLDRDELLALLRERLASDPTGSAPTNVQEKPSHEAADDSDEGSWKEPSSDDVASQDEAAEGG